MVVVELVLVGYVGELVDLFGVLVGYYGVEVVDEF